MRILRDCLEDDTQDLFIAIIAGVVRHCPRVAPVRAGQPRVLLRGEVARFFERGLYGLPAFRQRALADVAVAHAPGGPLDGDGNDAPGLQAAPVPELGKPRGVRDLAVLTADLYEAGGEILFLRKQIRREIVQVFVIAGQASLAFEVRRPVQVPQLVGLHRQRRPVHGIGRADRCIQTRCHTATKGTQAQP